MIVRLFCFKCCGALGAGVVSGRHLDKVDDARHDDAEQGENGEQNIDKGVHADLLGKKSQVNSEKNGGQGNSGQQVFKKLSHENLRLFCIYKVKLE